MSYTIVHWIGEIDGTQSYDIPNIELWANREQLERQCIPQDLYGSIQKGSESVVDTRKEQERGALHSTIWRIANELRGAVDGWDFKQYVLGMLFYRFMSENLCEYINRKEQEAGSSKFNYAKLSDSKAERARKGIRDEKGFFIKPSELFENVQTECQNDDNLNETLANVFRNIENSAKGTSSENDMKGLFDDINVNSGKLGTTVASRNEKLSKLLNSIGNLKIISGGGAGI